MGLFGYFLFKKLIFDLADEVLDDGDSLVVRFGNQEDRIPLSEITNVSCSVMTNLSELHSPCEIPDISAGKSHSLLRRGCFRS